MTTILLNGEERQVADGTTVAALLDTLDVPEKGRGVAIAIDAEVVPRGAWPDTALPDGAQVEVVIAIQGG